MHTAPCAPAGLYVTTHPKQASSQPLDVREAQQQLVDAEGLIESLSQVSEAHQAESLGNGQDALKTFTDATQESLAGASSGGRTSGGRNANAFKEPVMLFAAAGIGMASQQSVRRERPADQYRQRSKHLHHERQVADRRHPRPHQLVRAECRNEAVRREGQRRGPGARGQHRAYRAEDREAGGGDRGRRCGCEAGGLADVGRRLYPDQGRQHRDSRAGEDRFQGRAAPVQRADEHAVSAARDAGRHVQAMRAERA